MCEEQVFSSWIRDDFSVSYGRKAGVETAELVPLSPTSHELLLPYAQSGTVLLDPLAQLCLETSIPFVWEEELMLAHHHTPVRRAFSQAHDFAAPDTEEWSGEPFSGLRARVRYAGLSENFDTDARCELNALGTVLHQRMGELHRIIAKRHQPLHLTEREQETLKWGALGKTSDDIAIILGLTKRTVDQHFENAARKLGTHNRVQTVVMAYKHRLITI
jgi:LuxR family transcriptional regulator, quorum-sensing system regulator BjaR1